MKGRVEPHPRRRQRRRQICKRKVKITVRQFPVGIGQLVLVEVDNRWQCSQGGWTKPEKFREVEHVGTEDCVPRFSGTHLPHRFVGKRDGRMTHSPFPFVGRQRQQVEPMTTVRNPAVEKCTMAAAVIRIERENVHDDLLLCRYSNKGCHWRVAQQIDHRLGLFDNRSIRIELRFSLLKFAQQRCGVRSARKREFEQ